MDSNSSDPGPRSGGPTRRRTISPAQKLDHLAAYEAAITRNEGGAYLREQGIYSSQITEWRKLRDAGALAGRTTAHEILMTAYRELTASDIPTRSAARLTGVSRATATRKPRTPLPVPAAQVVPANRLTDLERARILRVVNSPEFVDLPPLQIYARLLDEGLYLGSISTIYRVLAENREVKERRRLATHPARSRASILIAT